MLLTFDHREKMVGKSVKASAELSEGDSVPVEMSPSEAEDICFEVGDTLLVLVTTSTKSQLIETSPVTNDHGYKWVIEGEIVKRLNDDDETITVWTTNTDKLEDISVNNLSMDKNLITGNENDPTGGTDLFIRTRELRPRDDKEPPERFGGSFRLPSTPIREWVNSDTDTLTFKFSRTDRSPDPTVTVERPLISNGVKATAPEKVRNKLGINAQNHEINIWATTSSIVGDNTKEEDSKNSTEEAASKPSAEQESDKTTAQAATTEETHLSQVSNGKEPSPPKQDESKQGSTTSAQADPSADSGTTRATKQADEISGSLLGDKEITPEVNSDLTPVVLLDKDERTQENWTGHYQDEDGNLLCGRDYTKAIPDPERNHYSEVCKGCLQERPGSLSEEDITAIFEKITGSKFTDDLPIILDRKKAAEVISVVSKNIDL